MNKINDLEKANPEPRSAFVTSEIETLAQEQTRQAQQEQELAASRAAGRGGPSES